MKVMRQNEGDLVFFIMADNDIHQYAMRAKTQVMMPSMMKILERESRISLCKSPDWRKGRARNAPAPAAESGSAL